MTLGLLFTKHLFHQMLRTRAKHGRFPSAIQMTYSFDRKNLAAYCNQYKLTVPGEYDTMKICTDYIKSVIG